MATTLEVADPKEIKSILPGNLKGKHFPVGAINDLNAIWHAINDGDVYTSPSRKKYSFRDIYRDSSKKREAFDLVYDTATEYALDDPTLSRNDDIKEYMRSAWLQRGFEMGDGNDDAFEMAKVVAEIVQQKKPANAARALQFTLDRWNAVDDFLKDDKVQKFIAERPDLWDQTYKDTDVASILNAVYKGLPNGEIPENLRNLIGDAATENTVKVKPVITKGTDQERVKDIHRYLKQGGIDASKAADRELLQDLVTAYSET